MTYANGGYNSAVSSDISVQMGRGSLLKGILKGEENDFIRILGELAKGEDLTINGKTISIQDDPLTLTLYLGKYMADREAIDQMLWKIFNFEKQLMDSINQAFS